VNFSYSLKAGKLLLRKKNPFQNKENLSLMNCNDEYPITLELVE